MVADFIFLGSKITADGDCSHEIKRGGIGMGNTCKSMTDSFQCMTKPTTIKNIYIFNVKNNNNKIKIKDAYSLEGKL